jgi:hypothetical protein
MYKVTITRDQVEEVVAGKDWTVVDEDAEGKDIRGYTPEIVKKKNVERTLMLAWVEDLDIQAVVRAVYKMNGGG